MLQENLAAGTEQVALKLSHVVNPEYATIVLQVVYVANNCEFGNGAIGNYLDSPNEYNKYNSLVISAQVDADECRAYSWNFGFEVYGIMPNDVMAMKAPVLSRLNSAYISEIQSSGEPQSFADFAVLVARVLNVSTLFVKSTTKPLSPSIYKRVDVSELKRHVDNVIEIVYKQLEAEAALELQYA
jgi:hypothetical protein